MISSSGDRLGDVEGRLAASVPQNMFGGLTGLNPSQQSARLANAGRAGWPVQSPSSSARAGEPVIRAATSWPKARISASAGRSRLARTTDLPLCESTQLLQLGYSVILVRSSQALVTPPARATNTGPTRT